MTGEIRFHLDECVPDAVAQGLKRRRISVSTTETVGLSGADDETQLSHAQQEGRVLVTQDSDFLRLAARDEPHSGIVYYAPGTRSAGQVIHFLVMVHGVLAAEEMEGRVEFV